MSVFALMQEQLFVACSEAQVHAEECVKSGVMIP